MKQKEHQFKEVHGYSRSKVFEKALLFERYCSAKKRCIRIKKYRDTGIKFLWKDFISFRDDMEKSFLKQLKKYGQRNTVLDRIDNTKGYYKENCRWITFADSNRNRTNSNILEYKGKKYYTSELAAKFNIPIMTVYKRLEKGWSVKEVVEIKKHGRKVDNFS
jgi:hypothetical protein